MIKVCTSSINNHSWIYLWDPPNEGGAIFIGPTNNYVKEGSIIRLNNETIKVLEEGDYPTLSIEQVIKRLPPVGTFHSAEQVKIENFKNLLRKFLIFS